MKLYVEAKKLTKILGRTVAGMIVSGAVHVASAGTVKSVPEGFKECAKDGGKCEFSGNWTGYYGANSTFVEISGSGTFTCLPGNLKVNDPVPNVQKTCFVKELKITSVPSDFKECAKDGGKCEFSGNWTGYYGANSTFVEISGSGTFTCLPGNLKVNDPVPNVQKTCFIKAAAGANPSVTQPSSQSSISPSALPPETVIVLKSKSTGKYMGPYERNGDKYFKAMYGDTTDPLIHLKISRPDNNASFVAFSGLQLKITDRPLLGVTVSNNFLYLMTRSKFEKLRDLFPSEYVGIDFKSLSMFTIEGTSLDSVRLKSTKTGTYVSLHPVNQSAVTGAQAEEFSIEVIKK